MNAYIHTPDRDWIIKDIGAFDWPPNGTAVIIKKWNTQIVLAVVALGPGVVVSTGDDHDSAEKVANP